jgi:hypothetical protein
MEDDRYSEVSSKFGIIEKHLTNINNPIFACELIGLSAANNERVISIRHYLDSIRTHIDTQSALISEYKIKIAEMESAILKWGEGHGAEYEEDLSEIIHQIKKKRHYEFVEKIHSREEKTSDNKED